MPFNFQNPLGRWSHLGYSTVHVGLCYKKTNAAFFEEYLRKVVTPTLERKKSGGAVAVKFEAAYLRPLDFDTPDVATARRVYARYAAGGAPPNADYKAVQDYLFRVIAREAVTISVVGARCLANRF